MGVTVKAFPCDATLNCVSSDVYHRLLCNTTHSSTAKRIRDMNATEAHAQDIVGNDELLRNTWKYSLSALAQCVMFAVCVVEVVLLVSNPPRTAPDTLPSGVGRYFIHWGNSTKPHDITFQQILIFVIVTATTSCMTFILHANMSDHLSWHQYRAFL